MIETEREIMTETASYSFEGLTIEKIITHRIYPKNENRERVEPKISTQLITLSVIARRTLESRLTKALGNKSHGIEMSIANTAENSFFQIAAAMQLKDEAEFIGDSAKFAHMLTDAQLNTNAPGGILLVLKGRVGDTGKPFVCVIKAEPQDGFRTKEEDDFITIEFLEELLLTDSARLFKIGFLVAETVRSQEQIQSGNYRAFLYDHLMTQTETRPAASYFYQVFLGMSIAASSRKLTQNFFEWTRNFIDNSDLSDEAKLDTHEALRVTLKSAEATISVNDFAQNYLPEDKQKAYTEFMIAKDFPQNAVSKDIEYIKTRLRKRRSYGFSNGVVILTPPEHTQDYMEIAPTEDGEYTVVTIKGQLQQQK
ncbi:nucleoid-associated protein [Uruburuella testudinis]|uniref:Nucleoid-associated protein n=1 Tax=Uruburuella testudinis TaxID=1282863 RepID=A0ABY4DYX9_9NEIS|nr:nucleoid-associated protein [Uruburuella testudinis]UOO82797.1 nucleoid-associated protein [Uruburuella testudinis]